ncbi:MAG: 4-oxalocrotonate tautomerase family protein [Nitrosopumilus sp.]|nr:4-oxalocrotonate tautomerase family protein [Nitrosopumilus sp.]CAI9831795.1 4-oxalocrotonate tautomerase [Nitrosopumilaceae archaeon]MDA7942144.1 4-oxalocrotonate tautomerase family protein [Nitrosopumilus sp.]MDA7943981.1 4-oxalocrotonate tautomerase family protein [Nitrosopumilus sp.]MDA7953722.1 4-oxalocrotonate tautomerase family protein [Nitrosopumilus sp.]
MPLITVSMYPGRTAEQKSEYAKEVTESAVRILGTKREHVIVVFDERPREDWYLAGSQL